MTHRCDTCRFWNSPFGTAPLGTCRIRAPTTPRAEYEAGNRTYSGAWPFVGSADWCGEHQPKEDAE